MIRTVKMVLAGALTAMILMLVNSQVPADVDTSYRLQLDHALLAGATGPAMAGIANLFHDRFEASDTGAPPGTATVVGRVAGLELGLSLVVPGARVYVEGGPETFTDGFGRFELAGIEPGERVLINVEPPPPPYTGDRFFGSNQAIVSLADGERRSLSVQLGVGCRRVIDAAAGGNLPTTMFCGGETRVGVDIPGGALLDEDGQPFTGQARIEVIPVDLQQDYGFMVFPGDMSALDLSGEPTDLESFGAAEVRVVDHATHAPLQIDPSAQIDIRIEVDNLDGNPEQPFWWYDVEQGKWIEEGLGQVVNESGRTMVQFQTNHLTWWNVDVAFEVTSCLRGQILYSSLPPPGQPDVVVAGMGTFFAHPANLTDDQGSFCVDVAEDTNFRLFAGLFDDEGRRYEVQSEPHWSGSPEADCATSAAMCTDLGPIEIHRVFETCIKGHFECGGGAVQNVTTAFITSQGIDSVVNVGLDGSFCANVAAELEVLVWGHDTGSDSGGTTYFGSPINAGDGPIDRDCSDIDACMDVGAVTLCGAAR